VSAPAGPRAAAARGWAAGILALLAAGCPDVTVRLFPGVSHAVLRDPDGSPGREMYLYRARLAPEVAGALAEWLAARLGRAGTMPGK
jgi:dienelactone hydrolase